MNSESQPVADAIEEAVPLPQRLYDNWVLLMIAGIAIMLLVYTGWGLFEILSMPPAELP